MSTLTEDQIFEQFGNGDQAKGREIAGRIAERLIHARQKHPTFAVGRFHAMGEMNKEFVEFQKAVEDESPERQDEEALDCAAVEFRWLCGEYNNP